MIGEVIWKEGILEIRRRIIGIVKKKEFGFDDNFDLYKYLSQV